MLSDQTFFTHFWLLIDFFGLYQPWMLEKKRKIRAIVIFILFFVIHMIFFFIGIFTSNDPDDMLHGIQTTPVLIFMLFDASNFIHNSVRIKEYYGKLKRKLDDVGVDSSQFYDFKCYFLLAICILVISNVLNLATFALNGKNGIPTVSFDSPWGFYSMMMLQAIFVIYSGLIYLFLDVFMCSLLFMLARYLEHMKDEIGTMKIDDVKVIVESHLEVIGLLNEYQKLFSMVILLRGFLNTLALSSIVIDIVDKGPSGMSLNVMIFGINGLLKLFIPCYYGSLIQENSEKLFTNFFNIPWMQMNKSQKNNFLILQLNLRQNMKLTAIKIVKFNLETFVSILQWTYSLYAALSVI